MTHKSDILLEINQGTFIFKAEVVEEECLVYCF